MANTRDADAATIVVRLDTEQAKRELASLNKAGAAAARSLSTGAPGGGGGGGSKGGARGGGGGGGGLQIPGMGGGVGRGAAAAGRLGMLGAVAYGAIKAAGAGLSAAGYGGTMAQGMGWIQGAWDAFGTPDSVKEFGKRLGMARGEASQGFISAKGRGSLRALDETLASDMVAHAVGKGIIEPLELRPLFELRKQRAQAIEVGRGKIAGAGFVQDELSELQAESGVVKAIERLGETIREMWGNYQKMGF